MKKVKLRVFVQIFFFVFIGAISINKVLEESGTTIPLIANASLHAVCPFGGAETFFSLISLGVLVKKIHASSLVLAALILVLALALGPIFCGWICPLGSIQEWFSKVGRKIFKKKFNNFVPKSIDKYLRYLRYFTLILILYKTTTALELVFVKADPYFALFRFWTDEATIGGIIVLVLTLILSFFIERPWCKYLCPYGALLGIFNYFRIFKIKRSPKSCISCGKCSRVCPMNIDVKNLTIVRNHQCISCLECTSENACPVKDAVNLEI